MENKILYRMTKTSTAVAAVASLLTGVLVALALSAFEGDRSERRISLSRKTFDDLAIRISVLEGKIGLIGSAIEDSNDVQIGTLAKEVVSTRTEVAALKNLILQDPEATLTLPLLKKDINQLNDSYISMRNDMNNMVGLSKWFIGSLITITVGLIGLVITATLKGK